MAGLRLQAVRIGGALLATLCGGALAAGVASGQDAPAAAASKPVSAQDAEFFEKNVRPVLAEQCYSCHSAATPKPMGGLRLDSREALLKGGDRGPSLKLGDPEKSLLLEALHYRDPALQMPPKGKLPEEKIQALARWVQMGAPWPVAAQGPGSKVAGAADPGAIWAATFRKRADHWSFKPLQHPSLPTVRNKAWVRTPIDAFILARLEKQGLKPNPTADRRTLIRRATFDLTGLPPTPAEVEAFVNDPSPDAWTKVVDRLLASPRYGERWGRHWLDLVRYAETNGHEFDFDKDNAWQYRDYVIRAFNADVPYSQFVTEQIAGDLLPRPRRRDKTSENESLIGTGFWWLGEAKHSAVDLKEDEREHIDNQIDVFTKTFTALTVGCARCHDHKFDAISTKDYYALSGYLKSSHYALAAADDPAKLEPALRELRPVQQELQPLLRRQVARSASQAVAELAAGVRTALAGGARTVASEETPAWTRLLKSARETPEHPLHALAQLARVPESQFAAEKERLLRELQTRADKAHSADRGELFEDFSRPGWGDWRVEGPAFSRQDESLLLSSDGEPRVEGLLGHGVAASNGLSERLRGTIRSRTFTIQKSKILYRMAGVGAHVNLIVQNFQLIRDPLYGRLKVPVNNPRMGWHVQDLSKFIGFRAYIEVVDPGPGWIAVDEIRFADDAPAPEPPSPAVLEILADPAVDSPAALADRMAALLQDTLRDWSGGRMTGAGDQRWSLLPWLVRLAPEAGITPAAEMAGLGDRLRKAEARIPAPTLVMSTEDGTPVDDHVCIRGSYKNTGALVPRRNLEVLSGAFQNTPMDRSGRLELAQRLLASPLTPRVWVNRVWQHHFGEGLVRTVDDFGIRGELPTHPELLDYLASVFTAAVEGPRSKVQGGAGTKADLGPGTPDFGPAWSTKALHRLILLSNTYKQSSRMEPKAEVADPQNKLLHRMPVLRLEAEAIRDSLLAISGRLDKKHFGPSVLPYLTPFMDGRGRPAESGPLDGDGRRSIYISVRRNFLTPMFLSFDYPIPFTTIGRRSVSTVPAQALTLMNNPFVLQQAGRWAKRELDQPAEGVGERIRRLYETAFSRPPTPVEMAAALRFLGDARAAGEKDEAEIWTDLCHVLINTKEFIFLN